MKKRILILAKKQLSVAKLVAQSKSKSKRKKETKPKTRRRLTSNSEHTVVKNFMDCGKVEVETALGRIDLETPYYIVEFKNYKTAKGALGQILIYSHFVKKKKVIVLFGKGLSTWSKYTLFERLCLKYNVTVYKLCYTRQYKDLKNKLNNNLL